MNKTERKFNPVVKHLLIVVSITVVLILAFQIFTSLFSRHGSEIEAPDFTGMTIEEAQKSADSYGVQILVTDTTHVRSMPDGCVINQNPHSGGKIKKGRRIRLTVNASRTRRVEMPNLIGSSLRSAIAELSARSLLVAKLEYVNDIATNNVLAQKYHGRDIAPGTKLTSESPIVLVLGLSDEGNVSLIPNLKGVLYSDVANKLHDNSLNMGRVIFKNHPKTYLDSMNSVVTKQYPDASVSRRYGTEVSIWLDESK